MVFNENIAKLRKQQGWTQEELGARLGVSAQSISKWENSVSMPDVCLLPSIAEILGTSIDELFGMKKTRSFCDRDDLPKQAHLTLLESINSLFDEKKQLEYYISEINKTENLGSVIFTTDGAVYADKNIGVIFPKTSAEAIDLLKCETAIDFVSVFSDKNCTSVLEYLARNSQFATSAAIATKCDISVDSVEKALQNLSKYSLAKKQSINLDDECIDVWRVNRTHALLFVYIIMQLAKRAAVTEDRYFYYRGKDCWCY